MLVLTQTAVAVVNNLTSAVGTEGAGLRISSGTTTPPGGGLQVEITPGPAEQDQVLSERGARVFLDPDAASYLDDKVLDANVDDQGGPHFMLSGQGPDGDRPTA
jgi:Fe-S cluster assembly iron-binding protein IscA